MFRRKANNAPIANGVAKVPVIMQMEALECGAACLAMVLAYYGKWIPLEQTRKDCGVSRDGSRAGNIARAARAYGLKAQGYRYSPQRLKEKGKFPCVIHWNMNHFVVLKGFKGGNAYLNDPARGTVTVSEEEFNTSFTGICIIFEPDEGFEPSGKPASVKAFAAKRLKGTGGAIAFVTITTALAAFFSILMSGLSRFFMDDLLSGENPTLVIPFLILISSVAFLQIVSEWIRTIYSLRISGKFAAIGNATYFWHVLCLPMEFFSQRMAGDIEGRRRSNAGIADSLINMIAPLFIDSAMLVFYLVVMLRYSVSMTMVGISSILINFILTRIISKKRVNITRVQMRDESKLISATSGGINMIDTIKSSGAENGYFRKWAGYQASVNTQNVRFERLGASIGTIPEIATAVVNDIILIMGVYLVIKGKYTPGMVIAFQGFLSGFLAPARSFVNAGKSIQEMRSQMERIEDVMEYPRDENLAVDVNPSTSEPKDKLSGNISIQHVTFGYARLAPPLIEDFNLELKSGKSVAIVGSSGCGKSTIGKLISGLYQPWSGQILYDGKHIKEIDRNIFTGSVAVVDQDVILFEDTISANIKMWDESIEDYEMIMAAKDAQLHEHIMNRDGGYNYRLCENGRDLSGGQRQRLEIARVLAQDPRLIILDEATSALDGKTEYEVIRSIKRRGITCIVIAHRLSTIRDCDEIIVLDRGKVIERGRHETLMNNNGRYKELVTCE